MTTTTQTPNLFFKETATLSTFINSKTEMKPLLSGLLYETETLLLYGASGSGKSLFTYSLASSLSSDAGEFIGQPTAKDLKVLYIDGEMHTNSIAQRAETFGFTDNLHYLASARLADTRAVSIDFNEESHFEGLLNDVRENGYNLVVLDSVRTLFKMEDENSAEGWIRVNELVMRLRTLGCVVIAIHHSTKDAYTGGETIWSGSSNAITVFDRTLGIQRVTDGVWKLQKGFKEGRSGDGWGGWVEDTCFTVGQYGMEKVDYINQRDLEILEFVDWLSGNGDLSMRNKVQEFNARFKLGIGSDPSFKKLWERTQDWWDVIFDDCSKGQVLRLFKGASSDGKPVFSEEELAINV